MEQNKRQVALVILDGWGYREDKKDNAIAAANLPFYNSLLANYPHSLLKTSGLAVGLPEGQIGNSEVGHMTIGAGRPIDTDLVRIAKAAKAGEFSTNPAFVKLFEQVKSHDSALHVLGLIGPGGVHASDDHLYAFLETAKAAGINKIFIHAITDGRDTPPQSSAGYIKELEEKLAEIGIGQIVSLCGRFYAMDRDNNWDRVDKAFAAIFNGQGETASTRPSEALAAAYLAGQVDEHLKPIIFPLTDGPIKINQNDGVFFSNFRADRAKMMTKKILEQTPQLGLCFVTLTEYDKNYATLVAFPSLEIETTLAKEVSLSGLSQVHIAETEKFAHATYFLNGGMEEPYLEEEHVLIESRKDIKTHDEAPEMKAAEIGKKTVEYIKKGTNFIFVNFANADMVGHTANVPAIIKGLEVVDRQLEKIVTAMNEEGGVVLITADHGNAELNIDQATGERHTAHTTNPVPAIITEKNKNIKDGSLADIAPTVLTLLNLKVPTGMTGQNLITDPETNKN